jgi:hypothetical protein
MLQASEMGIVTKNFDFKPKTEEQKREKLKKKILKDIEKGKRGPEAYVEYNYLFKEYFAYGNDQEYGESEYQEDQTQQPPYYREPDFSPFAGCDTLEKLEKRYKNLVKTYHPDAGTGDNDSLRYINLEYERLKKDFQK